MSPRMTTHHLFAGPKPPKPETQNPKPQTPNPKLPNPEPQTPNPKPQTPRPKPRTPNPQTVNPNWFAERSSRRVARLHRHVQVSASPSIRRANQQKPERVRKERELLTLGRFFLFLVGPRVGLIAGVHPPNLGGLGFARRAKQRKEACTPERVRKEARSHRRAAHAQVPQLPLCGYLGSKCTYVDALTRLK